MSKEHKTGHTSKKDGSKISKKSKKSWESSSSENEEIK